MYDHIKKAADDGAEDACENVSDWRSQEEIEVWQDRYQ